MAGQRSFAYNGLAVKNSLSAAVATLDIPQNALICTGTMTVCNSATGAAVTA